MRQVAKKCRYVYNLSQHKNSRETVAIKEREGTGRFRPPAPSLPPTPYPTTHLPVCCQEEFSAGWFIRGLGVGLQEGRLVR